MNNDIASEMDEAIVPAREDLETLPKEAVEAVGAWMKRHYLKAGYKRLSKLLLEAAPKVEG